ncbi:MAG: hypothetical protein AAB288_11090 [Acidobacteriota bacterium]
MPTKDSAALAARVRAKARRAFLKLVPFAKANGNSDDMAEANTIFVTLGLAAEANGNGREYGLDAGAGANGTRNKPMTVAMSLMYLFCLFIILLRI